MGEGLWIRRATQSYPPGKDIFLTLSNLQVSLIGEKGRKQNPSSQLSNWSQGEDRGKGAFSGEGLSSLSKEHREGGMSAVLGQSRSVLVPAKNYGNSVN